MKLLQINSTYNWGSTGRIAEEIGQMVISHGWESYLAYGRSSNKGMSIPIKIGNQLGIYYHVLMTRLFDCHGLASKWATRKLIKQIKRIKPDIIHLHNIHGYYLNYELLFEFLSSTNVPVVWTLHDCWIFTGHCYHTYINCRKFESQCYKCPLLKDYPSSMGIDRSNSNFRDKKKAFTSVSSLTLAPVSNWLAGELSHSFLKYYPTQVIHNGINIELFTPIKGAKTKLRYDDKFMILGVASIWSTYKGLEDFIELRSLLTDDIRIVLIGLSKEQKKKLPSGIEGICRTNNVEELATYYSAADVFFNPTWEDNFPTTNLEALACGTPVITYKTGGSPEAVNESTGFVVEQGDLNRTVEIINTIKEISKCSYTSICRERAVSNYDKRNCYEEYYRLYEKLLSKNNK